MPLRQSQFLRACGWLLVASRAVVGSSPPPRNASTVLLTSLFKGWSLECVQDGVVLCHCTVECVRQTDHAPSLASCVDTIGWTWIQGHTGSAGSATACHVAVQCHIRTRTATARHQKAPAVAPRRRMLAVTQPARLAVIVGAELARRHHRAVGGQHLDTGKKRTCARLW
jgi:hypothetical protein